jgi:sporulation protein YpjB
MFILLANKLKISAMIGLLLWVGTACGAANLSVGQAGTTNLEQIRKTEFLNKTADEMYKEAMDGKVMETRSKLIQIGDQIPKISFEGITSIEGIAALTEAVTAAKRVYNAVAFSPGEGLAAAAKVRLATDALTHKNQPMWLQYDKLLHADIAAMDQGLVSGKKQDLRGAMSQLEQHISIIKPSLQISREPSEVEKLNSIMAFVRTNLNRDPIDAKQVKKALETLQQIVDEIFMNKKDATAYLPIPDPKQPIIWSLVMGAIIISVLTYAGWRMFKTQKDIVPVKRNEKA